MSYLAKFGSDDGVFFSAAAVLGEGRLPADWLRDLSEARSINLSLRWVGGDSPKRLLLLSGRENLALQALVARMECGADSPLLSWADSASAFDRLTALGLPPEHLRVSHADFQHAGRSVACDYRLFSMWAGQGLPDGMAYQVILHRHELGREVERAVRKHLAWLRIERPYPPRMLVLQEVLSSRLLQEGWLADEYLLFPDLATRQEWEVRSRTHFLETSGRMGFEEPPLEYGEYSEWLATGCSRFRTVGPPVDVSVRAAAMLPDDEAAWLFRQTASVLAEGKAAGTPPDVFVSYSSSDFAKADDVRRKLEAAGLRCWIAPRDISLSSASHYTEAIPQAIKQVRAVLVLLSASANLSVHIPREIDLALARKLPIVPLRLANMEPQGQLEYLLRTCQWVDMFDKDVELAISELLLRLNALLW